MAIIAKALNMKRYVGTAKMLPASRTPRRLAIVMSPSAETPIRTRTSPRAGNADTICSTADDVETAAVRLKSMSSADAAISEALRPKLAFETEYEPPPVG